MLNIHSPQFSHSHKIDIGAHLSPSLRNKRVPSVQEIYSSSHWNRVNSSKKLDSPSKLSEKKRKRSQNSIQKHKSKNSQSMQNIASEMNFLRDEYKTLKDAYHSLIQEKLKNAEEAQLIRDENQTLKDSNEALRAENEKLKAESSRALKEGEKLRNKVGFMEQEIERIKKESFKMIEIEQFRARKLEENLQEKGTPSHIQKRRLKGSSAASPSTQSHPLQELLTLKTPTPFRPNNLPPQFMASMKTP